MYILDIKIDVPWNYVHESNILLYFINLLTITCTLLKFHSDNISSAWISDIKVNIYERENKKNWRLWFSMLQS